MAEAFRERLLAVLSSIKPPTPLTPGGAVGFGQGAGGLGPGGPSSVSGQGPGGHSAGLGGFAVPLAFQPPPAPLPFLFTPPTPIAPLLNTSTFRFQSHKTFTLLLWGFLLAGLGLGFAMAFLWCRVRERKRKEKWCRPQ